MGEVVVTALRREQALQDVPASIVALDDEDIERRQITQTHDLVFQAPGLVMGAYNGSNLPAIRGVSHDNTSGLEDSNVGIYIDGVYQPRPRAIDLVTTDVDRIEVLRGPQGTLYGRNSTGGAINFVTKSPSDTTEGEIHLLRGNYDRTQVRGAISGPLTDDLSFRLSALYNHRPDGYVKNLLAGAPNATLDSEKTAGVRLKVRYEPLEDAALTLTAHYARVELTPLLSMFTPPGPSTFLARFNAVQFTAEPFKIFSNAESSGYIITGGGSLAGEWKLSPSVTLSSTTAYQEIDQASRVDTDSTSGNFLEQHRRDDSISWSQELLLRSSLFEDRVDVIVGAFYLSEHITYRQFSPSPLLGSTTFRNNTQITQSKSLFGDVTARVTDRLRLYGGIRFTWDEKKLHQLQSQNTTVTCNNVRIRDKWSDVTPRLGAQFDVAPRVMVYGQWQRGFKSGGYNGLACNDPFNQETLTAWEAGLKSTTFDGRVTVNLTVFTYDYKNLQKQKIVDRVALVENAAGARVDGAELEVVLKPTDRLRLDFGLSSLDAHYTDFLSCDTMLFFGNCSAATIAAGNAVFRNVAGNTLSRAPDYTANFGLEYSFFFQNEAELVVRGEVYRSDEVHFREFGTPSDVQPAYTLTNLYATYVAPGGRWTVQGFVKNASNEAVIGSLLGASSPSFNRNGNFLAPRTYGVEIGARF